MCKKIASIVLIITLLVSLSVTALAGNADYGVIAEKSDNQITVSIVAVKATQLASLEYDLSYPSDKLTLTSTKAQLQRANNYFYTVEVDGDSLGAQATVDIATAGVVKYAIAVEDNVSVPAGTEISKMVFSINDGATGDATFAATKLKTGAFAADGYTMNSVIYSGADLPSATVTIGEPDPIPSSNAVYTIKAEKNEDQITVSIVAENATQLASFEFDLSYPSDKLTLTSTKSQLQRNNNFFYTVEVDEESLGAQATVDIATAGLVKYAIAVEDNVSVPAGTAISKMVFSINDGATGDATFAATKLKTGAFAADGYTMNSVNYADAELPSATIILPVPHTHTPGNAVNENVVAADCTHGGSYDEVVYCTTCGEELSRSTKTISANGHTFVNGKCTVCGISENAMKISAAAIKTTAGKNITVKVNLENNPGVNAMKLQIGYNSNALTLASVTDKNLFGSAPTKSKNLTDNPYTLIWATAGNTTENGELLELTFHVADTAEPGTETITLTASDTFDENDAAVAVSTENVTVTIQKFETGDSNGDGQIDVRDATRLLQYFVGWDVTIEDSAADANGDGIIDVRDVTRILQYLAGWDVKLGK